jgi:hypothetical protein
LRSRTNLIPLLLLFFLFLLLLLVSEYSRMPGRV